MKKSIKQGIIPVLIASSLIIVLLYYVGYEYLSPISFVKVETERTQLIDGFKSYQSIEELKKNLEKKNIKWEIVEDSRLAINDKRPPFNIYIITAKNYSHLGFSGDLNITFFNNRLMATTFYPMAIGKYIEAFTVKEGVMFNDVREARILPFTRIIVAEDYKHRGYIVWRDIRLDKEFNTWIKRYS